MLALLGLHLETLCIYPAELYLIRSVLQLYSIVDLQGGTVQTLQPQSGFIIAMQLLYFFPVFHLWY